MADRWRRRREHVASLGAVLVVFDAPSSHKSSQLDNVEIWGAGCPGSTHFGNRVGVQDLDTAGHKTEVQVMAQGASCERARAQGASSLGREQRTALRGCWTSACCQRPR